MSHKDASDLRRWCGLTAVVILLALCVILLSGQAVTAKSTPSPSQSAVDRTKVQPGEQAIAPPPIQAWAQPPAGGVPAPLLPQVRGTEAGSPPDRVPAGSAVGPLSLPSSVRAARQASTPPAVPRRAESVEPVSALSPVLPHGEIRPPEFGVAALGTNDVSALADSVHGLMPMSPPLAGSTDLVVCMTTDRVWGLVGAGETATVTVDSVQMGAAQADDTGFFWTTLYDAGGNRLVLDGGEDVAIYHDSISATVTLRTISGTVNIVNDVVSGTIGGISSAISVTVYVGWDEPSMTSYSQTVSTDGSGNFSADFAGIWDFVGWDGAVLAYVEDGVEVHRHVYPAPTLQVRPFPWNWVFGQAAPGEQVTATVFLSDSTTIKDQADTKADGTGSYFLGTKEDILVSDVVVVDLAGGTVMSRTVDLLTEAIDADADLVTGQAPPGAVVLGRIEQDLTPLGWRMVNMTTTVAASGWYTLDFGGVADLMPGTTMPVFMTDAEGDDVDVRTFAPDVVVNQTWNEVSGHAAAPPGPLADGRLVTLTLYSAAADATTVYVRKMGSYGTYSYSEKEDGLPDIAPGDVITVESEGFPWQGVVKVQTMAVASNQEANQFTGTVVPPTDRVELAGQYVQPQLYPAGGQFDMLVTASSPFTASPPGFDVRGDLNYDVAHRTAGDYAERISRRTDGIGEKIDSNNVGGAFNPPGVAYTVTLYSAGGDVKTQVTGNSAETDGSFWINLWDYGKEQIEVGDYLQGQSAAGFSHTVQIPAIAIDPDPATNIVSGQGPANALLLVTVENQGQGFVPSDGNGQFTVAVDQLQEVWGNGDLEWGDNVWVNYYDANNAWFANGFQWPQITARSDMAGGNAVFGYHAIPGNTIYVTVTHPVSGVIATGTTTMGTCDWCDYWLDLPGDTIVPNNIVTVDFGDGFVDSMTVLTITAEANPDTDVVTVTAPVGAIVSIYLDGPNGGWDWGWKHEVPEVGSEGYVVFNLSGEYDVVYGTFFYVHTYQAHGHWTEYEFWLPAPDVGASKWTTGGHARPGGLYVYGIYYENNQNATAPATDTLLVDILPPGTTYAGDSSGLTPAIGAGGVITWDLGELAPGDYDAFMVTLDVSPTVPTGTQVITPNCVFITTTTPGDYEPGDNYNCSGGVDVWPDDVEIGVDKWPSPGDPTPGQEFDYDIRWCNNRGAAAGPAWLTDTLPVSTTLLDWWPQNWWEKFWTEVSRDDGQLVLYAPGLPGKMCQDLYLRLLLDAGAHISTTLYNDIVLTTPGDVYTDNNWRLSDFHVSEPRWDMNTNKWYGSGMLVPGGYIRYGANWWNAGNIVTHAWLTDTLPAATSYQPGSGWHNDGYPFEPNLVTGEYAVWDLGVVQVNRGRGLDFSLDVSDTVAPGTVLTNCVAVGITATESTPWDNTACVAETINKPGPNLRVRKEHQWYGDNQLHYEINFENIGTETIYNVAITDTYPISTSFHGDWGHDFWENVDFTPNPTAGQLMWSLDRLEPGWNSWLRFTVDLDDPNARPRWYTNTVEISTPPDDVNSTDNSYQDVAVKTEVERVELFVASEGDSMWGQAQPNAPITITVGGSAFTGTVGGDGGWNIYNLPAVNPGETFTVTAGRGLLPVVITVPDPFSAEVDSILDRVWGQIGGWANRWGQVHGEWPDGYRDVQTDGAGNYLAVYPDVPRGGGGYVRFVTEETYAQVILHRRFYSPDLVMTVNYAHDWVEGNYEAGHTVWLTVTNSGGTVKGTAIGTTGLIPWWNGQSGFSTNYNVSWTGQQPDIVPGDWVYGLVESDSYTTSVHIGTITGTLDVVSNTVSGNVYADWFTQTLNGNCGVWVQDGPNRDFQVEPDGGSYLCDFSPFDLLPDQDVYVEYREPDGDWVLNVFRQPAPDLQTDKYGQGQPAPGGNYVYTIHYRNQGNAAASSVLLTDTLPSGMAYITDTSGFAHSGSGGGSIVWDVGTLDAGVDSSFDVFVAVDPGLTPGTRVTNTVDIASPDYDPDPGNNHHEWWTDVVSNDTHLNVGKWSWGGGPPPGYDLVFSVNTCNNGGTASSQLTLTDTLHPSMTVQYWWPDDAGWTEVARSDHQLVLSRPSIPGGWCGQVYLRAHVDGSAWPGMSISNTAVITASSDMEGNDNETTWWGNVDNPHPNINISKGFNSGQLVPGGELRYNINYSNNGNVPVGTVRITDTLPLSTTFREWHQGSGMVTATLVVNEPGYLVWQVNGMDNGYGGDFEVVLDVDSGASVGTVLTNTAEITPLPDEDSYDDNTSVWVEELYRRGANLRVSKRSWWNGNGQLEYRIRFENIGSDPVPNVWITDTLPLSTAWDGWWNPWFDGSRIISQSLTSGLLKWEFSELYPGDSGEIGFHANLDQPGAPMRWYTNTVDITTPPGDVNPDDNTYQDVVFSGAEVESVDLDLYRTRTWGCAYSAPVTITTASDQMVIDWDRCWDVSYTHPFTPGIAVTVTAGDGLYPVVIHIPEPFTGYASSITDTVWGQIDALDHEPVEVDLWGFPTQHVETDGSGHYLATYADVPRGAEGDVNYYTDVDYTQVGFHHRFQSPYLRLRVNQTDNWVDACTSPGATVWVTITNALGSMKGTASGVARPDGCISANEFNWGDGTPDIVVGDHAAGSSSDGSTATATVITITGYVDSGANTLSGQVMDVPYPATMQGEIWEPGATSPVTETDDYGYFTLNFTPFDIQPGMGVAAWYIQPDGNWVGAIFQEPAANVAVDKYGQGQPAPGGNYVYRINYHNYGNADAHNVVLTDTLPTGMSYITDTSGLPYTGSGGGPIAWDVGTVYSYTDSFFDVFVAVDPGLTPGTRVTNTVDIASPDYDPDPDNNHRKSWTDVVSNDTHLNVGKGAWTGDPAPGYEVVFNVNTCNNGGTASSQLTLTDTLHPSMTVQYWWPDDAGWTERSRSSQQLVLSRPSVNGWSCSQVYLRAHVDGSAWPGMSISNTAVITASSDMEGNDNETTWWGNVNNPHTNLYVNKSFNSGQLVPGGELRYGLNYSNNGNVPVGTVRITDTLPLSTTFREWHQGSGMVTATLVVNEPGYLVWQVNGMDNGYGGDFEVVLDVDSGASVGTVLTNTAEITPLPGEDSYDDNIATAVETVYGHGPNLRVRKDGGWHGDRAGHAWYNFVVQNVGDGDPVPWAVVTDTYPAEMTLEGDPWTDWGRVTGYHDDAAGHWFTFTMENLQPGYALYFGFNATMADPVAPGLILTNTAAVAPGGVVPDDDSDSVVLTTGPDLWVKKDLVAGEVLPGELLTFDLAFGNKVEGWQNWWNMKGTAWLTDTLPPELEYVTSTLHWCGWTEWCAFPRTSDDGTHSTWQLWPLAAGEWNEIHLTVRVTDTVEAWDAFTNWVQIASDQPANDAEVDLGNNQNSYDLLVVLPRFEVSKAYQGSRVAGTVVTYTLTVTNTGNADGTNVVLSDTLPTGLTYDGSDGIFDGTDITWSFATIAASGGTASGQFWGTLPCTAGLDIVNDTYLVVTSTEGVTSPPGAAVSFAVAAPAITATLDHTPKPAVAGKQVDFTAGAGTNGTALTYAWYFGEGTAVSGGLTAQHVYDKDGSYTAVFTATDECGYSKVATDTVTVNPACTGLTSVDLAYTPPEPVIQSPVVFTATYQPPDATAPITYVWAFGDGQTVTVTTPSVQHTYTIYGVKTVTVTIYNPCTPAGVSWPESIAVAPLRVYLPLVLRNH
jgi:uncharacterized repeat protein (TIGR01451 family)